mmetsp:Transcript_82370/g.266756  ORF Transcript_82370/g.266756 Transcript_82370/m.266756 type:complete len:558 (+) Transcript_82370:1697-3370(+)
MRRLQRGSQRGCSCGMLGRSRGRSCAHGRQLVAPRVRGASGPGHHGGSQPPLGVAGVRERGGHQSELGGAEGHVRRQGLGVVVLEGGHAILELAQKRGGRCRGRRRDHNRVRIQHAHGEDLLDSAQGLQRGHAHRNERKAVARHVQRGHAEQHGRQEQQHGAQGQQGRFVDPAHHPEPMASLHVRLLRRVGGELQLLALAGSVHLHVAVPGVAHDGARQGAASEKQQRGYEGKAGGDAGHHGDPHAEAAALQVVLRQDHAAEERDGDQRPADHDGVTGLPQHRVHVRLQLPTIAVLLAETRQKEKAVVQAQRHDDRAHGSRHIVGDGHDVHPRYQHRGADDERNDDEEKGQQQKTHVLDHPAYDDQGDRNRHQLGPEDQLKVHVPGVDFAMHPCETAVARHNRRHACDVQGEARRRLITEFLQEGIRVGDRPLQGRRLDEDQSHALVVRHELLLDHLVHRLSSWGVQVVAEHDWFERPDPPILGHPLAHVPGELCHGLGNHARGIRQRLHRHDDGALQTLGEVQLHFLLGRQGCAVWRRLPTNTPRLVEHFAHDAAP